MTITSDKIKKAFNQVAKAKPVAPQDVDLEKVATSFQDTVAKFGESEDPMAGLDALETEVTKFEDMLGEATQAEDGSVTVSGGSVEFAKSFAPDEVEAPKVEKTDDPAPKGEEKTEKKEDEASKTEKKEDAKGEETDTEKGDDLSDDINWEDDLSPSVPPTMRNERLTKGERPVPARVGGRKATQKAEKARDAAMARRGSGSRTLS